MSNLQDVLTGYGLRARLYPALLTVFPAMSLVLTAWNPENLATLWPLCVSLGVPFLISSLVRSKGKKLQQSLLFGWGGFPTTRLLRANEPGNPVMRERRRQQMEALIGQALPSEDEEQEDPVGADHRYEAAVRTLIARTHGDRQAHYLVEEENASYGFRRNLLAMKPIALVVLGVCLCVDAVLLLNTSGTAGQLAVSCGIHVVLVFVWLLVVRPRWVLEAAEDYAKSLYDALERLSQHSETPPTSGTHANG